MRTRNLDHLLEAAVAKALGVPLPVHHRRPHRAKRNTESAQRIRKAA